MQIGMIGLGRMGANMARRLMKGGHESVVFDRNAVTVEALAKEGATGAASLEEVVEKLRVPRALWIMLPSGAPDGIEVDDDGFRQTSAGARGKLYRVAVI